MEAYRSGRLARQSKSTPAMRAVQRKDALTLVYPELRVLVLTAGLTELAGEVVKAFRGVNCRVAFTASDSKASPRLAQQAGARYYPSTTVDAVMSDLTSRWGGVDIVVNLIPDHPVAMMGGEDGPTVIEIAALGIPSTIESPALARYILFLAHPGNKALLTAIPCR